MNELTPGASLAWSIAAAEAISARHALIQSGHLLVGLLSLDKVSTAAGIEPRARAAIVCEGAAIAGALTRVAADPKGLRRLIRDSLGQGEAVNDGHPVSRSAACKAVFRRAEEKASGAVSALALLIAVLKGDDDVIRAALEKKSIPRERLLTELANIDRTQGAGPQAESAGGSATPTLERFGRDLTALAASGKIGPIIGRRRELLQVLQTLARSSKNNPVLVGEAGVGKTAIVEALALRASAGKDPMVLGGKRIVELGLGAVLAGSRYRGEFEERLMQILSETRSHPEVLVFIDEIHTVVGAGSAGDQALDAANILKPALARGEIRCIGATTLAEYRRHIEADPALDRRFEKVMVEEPTREETLEILRGIRPRWEAHHRVRILDAALGAAVDLALRFDTDHQLPDKAVDLVDKAAARTRVPILSMKAPAEGDESAQEIASVGTGEVTEQVVAYVLAEKLGLPPERVLQGLEGAGLERLLQIEGFLRQRLVGQDDASQRIAARLRLAHSGVKTRRGPLAVFLFLGPTGVGKTEMARLVAEFLFGSPSDLIRLDMSEYMEEHSISKLIGAPPGYVGHDEEKGLPLQLKRRPYSVVLLDEVEKAHPRVFDLFLQVFDEGRLTDSKGRSADARHAIFVMTSNLGTAAARDHLGFSPGEEIAVRSRAILEEARRWFRPELWNRIDEVIVFRPLVEEDAARILRNLLGEVSKRVAEQHQVSLRVTPEAEALILHKGFSPSLGVRELQRTLERLVLAPFSHLVVSGKVRAHRHWQAVYDEGGIYLLPKSS